MLRQKIFVYKVLHAEGQMHKTRGTWRTEHSEGKCNRVGLNIEMLSVSIVDEGAGGETLAGTLQGCFVFLPDDVLRKKQKKMTKLAPLNNVSVFDTFCERGPYSPPQLKLMGRGATF